MREILFRGKRIDNGEWVEGSLSTEYYQNHGIVLICPSEDEDVAYKVDPETVGQYTGLTNKNGVKAFEHDVIKTQSGYIYMFWYDEKRRSFLFGIPRKVELTFSPHLMKYRDHELHSFEIIGNIHDCPKLMKALTCLHQPAKGGNR